jgi:hypothetical protein
MLFWVDPNKGFTIPRVCCYREGGRYKKRTLYEEVKTELKEHEYGVWYPIKIIYDSYNVGEDGIPQKDRTATIEYDMDYVVNAPVNDNELVIDLPSGTRVYDETLDMSYKIP